MENGGDKKEVQDIFAYVLACGDPEIKLPLTREFNDRFGPKGYFWLPELGGSKDLSSPDIKGDRERLFRKIRDAYAVHHFGLIVLVNHSNCGKYKLSGVSFNDPRKEEEFHKEELNKAAEFIKKEFPDMVVEILYFLKVEQKTAWRRILSKS